MKVGMVQEILPLCLKQAEKANLGTEMFWIGGDLQQGRRTGSKQERIQNLFVVKGQRS